MAPTLKHGQIILGWHSRTFKPGQVVVAYVQGQEVVKRIKSTNGGTVRLEGDNSKSSTDSRDYGSIPDTKIEGVVIWPRTR